jgi:hypothetical protein
MAAVALREEKKKIGWNLILQVLEEHKLQTWCTGELPHNREQEQTCTHAYNWFGIYGFDENYAFPNSCHRVFPAHASSHMEFPWCFLSLSSYHVRAGGRHWWSDRKEHFEDFRYHVSLTPPIELSSRVLKAICCLIICYE